MQEPGNVVAAIGVVAVLAYWVAGVGVVVLFGPKAKRGRCLMDSLAAFFVLAVAAWGVWYAWPTYGAGWASQDSGEGFAGRQVALLLAVTASALLLVYGVRWARIVLCAPVLFAFRKREELPECLTGLLLPALMQKLRRMNWVQRIAWVAAGVVCGWLALWIPQLALGAHGGGWARPALAGVGAVAAAFLAGLGGGAVLKLLAGKQAEGAAGSPEGSPDAEAR